MDDDLEQPTSISKTEDDTERPEDNEELSSGEEDEGPDWTKLPTVSRPVIPKRGEKDFEPNVQGGSGLQRHVLDRARNAMFDALRAERNTSSKTISYGIWYPGIARTHVTTARGIHFTAMGHSVARAASCSGEDARKIPKRLELLPEEALYLVERGAMFCWKATDASMLSELEDVEGEPMTVQQAFTEMIETADLTLEKYQVFSYLKRLGYVVTRTKCPSPAYPEAAPFPRKPSSTISLWKRLVGAMSSFLKRLFGAFLPKFDWWRPIQHSRWLLHNKDNESILRSLRFLPSGHSAQLHNEPSSDKPPSPYQIFFNLYKPSTPFKKTSPPPPDFSIVVINARTTPMPTLSELTSLFDVLPELPPPVPRKRQVFVDISAARKAAASAPPAPAPEVSYLRRLLSWIYPLPPSTTSIRKPNPFAVLKAGKKMVVIAAVDAGTISFFSFRQGAFEEFPMA